MKRHHVDSSAIVAVGYDDSSGILEVIFQTGRTYRYSGVPAKTYDELLHADSIGGYFNREIRPRYRGVEVKSS